VTTSAAGPARARRHPALAGVRCRAAGAPFPPGLPRRRPPRPSRPGGGARSRACCRRRRPSSRTRSGRPLPGPPRRPGPRRRGFHGQRPQHRRGRPRPTGGWLDGRLGRRPVGDECPGRPGCAGRLGGPYRRGRWCLGGHGEGQAQRRGGDPAHAHRLRGQTDASNPPNAHRLRRAALPRGHHDPDDTVYLSIMSAGLLLPRPGGRP